MSEEDQVIWLFEQVHGLPKVGSCYVEVEYCYDTHVWTAHLMKDGHSCWSETREVMLASYLLNKLTEGKTL